MTQQKVCFISLDGADRNLILQWTKAGLLPTLQSLLERGAFRLTQDPFGVNGCHWATLFSGVSPMLHGRYCFRQIQPGTYDITTFSFPWEPWWQAFSKAGRKVMLIDLPDTPLVENLNGIQVVLEPNENFGTLSFQTYPSSLATAIEAKLGQNPVGGLRSCGRSLNELKTFRENLLSSIENKTELINYLLNDNEWELLITVFRESHWAGHQFWHLHDASHPEYDPEIVKALGNPLQDIYIALDRALAEILQQLEPETTVILLASTGMGPNYTGIHLLDEILLRVENPELARKSEGVSNTLSSLKKYKFLRQIKKRLWKSLKNFRGESKSSPQHHSNPRQYFQVPSSEAYGAIRLNLVGREPDGKIQPGSEYDTFCEALSQDLLEIINLDTGESIVQQIFPAAAYYQGKHSMGVPDLLVEWNRNAPISSIYSPKIGKINKRYRDSQTGDHKTGGLLLISSPSIKQEQIEEPISIIDIAPTIASLLDISLTQGDGKSIAILNES